MNASENKIRLCPNIKQFVADEFYVIILLCVAMLMCGYEDNPAISMCSLVGVVLLSIYLFGRWGYYKTITWEITPTHIKSICGIFRRETNYVELYRIVDYSEEQTFVQQLLGLKDVYIISSDRTDPALRIFGIPNSLDLISEIKPLVKQTRMENHIYEIANS